MFCLIGCLVCSSVVGPHSMPIYHGRRADLDLAAFDTTSTALQQAGQIMHADKYAKWVRQVPSPLHSHHAHTPFHTNWLIHYYKFVHICHWLCVCVSNVSVSIVRGRDRSQKCMHSKGRMQTRLTRNLFFQMLLLRIW